MKETGILIYGPQGCGKSIMAPLLARHYGKRVVVENWYSDEMPPAHVLALTSDRDMLSKGAIEFFRALADYARSEAVQGVEVVEHNLQLSAQE